MTMPQLPFTGLSEEERRTLQRWLADFERSWEPDCLAARLAELPPDTVGRPSALCEAVKIDLRKQWQSGRKRLLDAYLDTYPELGGRDGVALDLIQAEAESRREAGDPVSWSEYVRRFPRQTRALQRSMEQMLQATASLTQSSPEQQSETLTVPRGPTPATNQIPDTLQRPPGSAAPPSLSGSEVGRYDGRYTLVRKLPGGNMADVYLAYDTKLHRDVALKIPRHLEDDNDRVKEVLARFDREGRAMAKLKHPNICPVHDVGEVDGLPYFTMDFIEGTPMSRYLRDHRPVPQRRAAELVHRLALAMQEAHNHGIIHRDLKSSNIMMNQRSEPIILDFGLARHTDVDEPLTREGSVLGTPAYMPKEQAAGEITAIGRACDIYSLGVILYEMLAGQLPFRGNLTEILTQLLTETPPTPPSKFRPDLDPELEQICLKAMAPKAEQRYLTMGEFAAALGHFLDKSKGEVHSPETLPPNSSISPGRRWWMLAGLVGGVLAEVLLLAILWSFWKELDDDRRTKDDNVVVVNSTPPGAKVTVKGVKDGKNWPSSQTNLDQSTFYLPRGKHHLHAALAGHQDVDMEFDVPISTPHLEVVLDSLQPRKFALLVGIRSPCDELPDFVDAEPDVVELGRVLVAGGYDANKVFTLTQTLAGKKAPPSPETIRARLHELVRTCTPPDSLLVALVGHQVTEEGASYYCASGSNPTKTDTLLPLGDVYDDLQKCKARSKLLLVDSWRGYFGKRERASGGRPPDQGSLKVPKGLQAFFNCSAKEYGYEHTDARHGIFLYFVIRGLQGDADADQDGKVTLNELVSYTSDKTSKFAQNEYGKVQRPQLVGAAMPSQEVLFNLQGALTHFREGSDALEKAKEEKNKEARAKLAATAVKAFDKAAKADPAYVETYTSRAAAHYFAEDLIKANADFKTALDRDPNNAGAHEDLATVMVEKSLDKMDQQMYQDALKAHQRAIDLDPHCAQGYNVRGMSYYKGQNYKQAITDFRKAIELNSKLKGPYYNCEQAALKVGDKQGALDVLTDCIKIHPGFADAFELRAEVHVKMNNPAAAAQDKKRVQELKKAKTAQK